MRRNEVKEAIKRGKPVVGSWLGLPSPDLVELLGWAGFDFVILDNEHKPFSPENSRNLIRAAEVANIVPVARMATNDLTAMQQALDAGALGVQIAHIHNKEEALSAIQNAKYHPLGKRGLDLSVRAARYGLMARDEYLTLANEEIMVIIQIENVKAVDNLPEILKVEGIDVIFIGPADLSHSLGLPGQFDHPRVQETIEQIITQTLEAGVPIGTIVGSVEAAKDLIERGAQYISIGSTVVPKTYRALVHEIKGR